MNFDSYLFRPHRVGSIMGGVPSVLTEKQTETYESLLSRYKDNVKTLTIRQAEEYAKLRRKLKDPTKNLTSNQKQKLFELMLIYESNSAPLSLLQVETLGDLSRKRKEKLHLNDSGKRHLDSLVRAELFKRSKNIQSLQIEKGIEKEKSAISLYSRVSGELFLDNVNRLENDFFSGELDILKNGIIYDIKASWEYDTFPMTINSIPTKGYEYQLDGYMDLWQVKQSKLVYCLVNTPDRLIDAALSKLNHELNIADLDGNVRPDKIDLIVEEVSQHLYTIEGLSKYCDYTKKSDNYNIVVEPEWFYDKFVEIPEVLRVKVFDHNYCKRTNEQIKKMILLSRDYMNSVAEEIGAEIISFSK